MWALAALVLAAAAAGAAAGGAGGAVAAESPRALGPSGACGAARLACADGSCVPADAWCDATPHCADGSDEPAHCSPCNRTLYGAPGREYRLALPPARLPFLCHLTFTAGGSDLVQLAFDEFRVGRYVAGAAEPCPDGAARVAELGRPYTGGAWCGEAEGAPALYFSETATVTLTLQLARGAVPLALALRYRFLPARAAVVRYGPAGAPLARGAPAPGTYCTRTFDECHRQPCRLQSPNYPGMYPRNVSCYWTVRQRDVPTCKHAMVSVRQELAHKMQIKRSVSMARMNKAGRWVRAWGACGGERDRLIVYDGGSTDDPVLLEYCGGDWLPPVTARGPEMLVAFHSAPRAAPPPAPPSPLALRGFELDVAVVFADSESLDYAREPRRCEFHVKAPGEGDAGPTGAAGAAGASGAEGAAGARPSRGGVLRAPRHTLPPNTTCTWTFHGRPGDLVWIYFASYTQYSLLQPARREEPPEEAAGAAGAAGGARGPAGYSVEAAAGAAGARAPDSRWARLRELLRPRVTPAPPPVYVDQPEECATLLRVWDGAAAAGAELARHCDQPPVLCARASLANATRRVRACAPPDGYVSSGPLLSLAVTSRRGTATHPLRFALHYEFVDARLPGEPLAGAAAAPAECARRLRAGAPAELWAPRNALWRGPLRCVFRVEGPAALSLAAAALGGGCESRRDPRSLRWLCRADDAGDAPAGEERELKVPHLKIYEILAPGYKVEAACVCGNSTLEGAELAAPGGLLLELRAPDAAAAGAAAAGAAGAAWFRARYWAAEAACPVPAAPGPGGALAGPCPVLLLAPAPRSVMLRVAGSELAPLPAGDAPLCAADDRVLVYDPVTAKLVSVVCPAAGAAAAGAAGAEVALWSASWRGAGGARALAVAAAGAGGAARWAQVWRGAGAGCVRCGADGPCVDAALACDGAADCPRGEDEAACGAALRVLAALGRVRARVAGAAAALLLLLLLLVLARRARAGRGEKQARPPPAGDPVQYIHVDRETTV